MIHHQKINFTPKKANGSLGNYLVLMYSEIKEIVEFIILLVAQPKFLVCESLKKTFP